MLEVDMLKAPWEHFDSYYQSRCIPLQQYPLGLVIDNKQTPQTIVSYAPIQSHKSNSGLNNPSANTQGTMIRCQNKFTDRKKTKNQLQLSRRNIYLLISCSYGKHKCVTKTVISAFDPPLAQSNSPNKRLYGFKCVSVKGHGLLSGKQNTVQSHVYCSSYSLFPYDK